MLVGVAVGVGRVAGMSRVQASAAGIGSSIQIETALVDPDKPGGTVTNYPNPFHPGETPTTIAYKLDADATVTLTIYTLSGNLVLRQEFPSGASGGRVGLNEFLWDGRNGKGTTVSSGGYIVHIRAEGAGETLHDMRRAIAVVR